VEEMMKEKDTEEGEKEGLGDRREQKRQWKRERNKDCEEGNCMRRLCPLAAQVLKGGRGKYAYSI
jgi:hypothetical protein